MRTVEKVAFYIVAHADDWQLFFYPDVAKEFYTSNCKVVFIITTAGDAGMGEQFWRAREEGSKSSIRFCLAPFSAIEETIGWRTVNGHAVNRSVINNTTSYFLRLPDGNLDGRGFASTGYNTLATLEHGITTQIETVDKSALYDGWLDLVATLEAIIQIETEKKVNGILSYLNPCTSSNPNDHPDHASTGRAIQAMSIVHTLHQQLFTGYNLPNCGDLLKHNDVFWKAGMMAAYEKAVFDSCGYSTLKEDVDVYFKWCTHSSTFTAVLPS
ncbi:hypothetical protein BH11BAC5_BH11BAC5_20470 [soil metagenome]